MKTRVIEADWKVLLTLLPGDLEASARAHGALRRRRGVPSAAVLLRLALAYAACGLSLRSVVAWAAQLGIAHLSDVALLKRLRQAGPWLGQLLAQKLAEHGCHSPAAPPLRVRLLDATSISRPGSHGTDWRVHLGFDLAAGCIDAAEVTPASEGETLTRHLVGPGEVAVADRGYGHRRGIAAVAAAGGELIVRLNSNNVPLETPAGAPFDPLEAVRDLAAGESAEFVVRTAPDPKAELPASAGRLVVLRKSEAATETAPRKLRRQAQRNGRTPDQRALAAAAYVCLFTTVAPARLTTREVLELYRCRWQIELTFKRLKGILQLDDLTARDPGLCRTFLLTKLLAMLLVEELARDYLAFSPWGYGLPAAPVALAALPGAGRDPAACRGHRPALRRLAAPAPRGRTRAARFTPTAP